MRLRVGQRETDYTTVRGRAWCVGKTWERHKELLFGSIGVRRPQPVTTSEKNTSVGGPDSVAGAEIAYASISAIRHRVSPQRSLQGDGLAVPVQHQQFGVLRINVGELEAGKWNWNRDRNSLAARDGYLDQRLAFAIFNHEDA